MLNREISDRSQFAYRYNIGNSFRFEESDMGIGSHFEREGIRKQPSKKLDFTGILSDRIRFSSYSMLHITLHIVLGLFEDLA